MPSIHSFGRYLPERVLTNQELARTLAIDPDWILQVSGIEERRIAADTETVADLAAKAAQHCLTQAPGLLIAASGSPGRRFPGPAAEIAHKLGLGNIPAIDIPHASTGSLIAIALAAQLTRMHGPVLVVAAEKMSMPAPDKNIAILFGDGAGACLISPEPGGLEIVDSALHSDGAHTDALHLELTGPVQMSGMSVIRHATRRLPEAITEVLARNNVRAQDVAAFLMHQANQNLIDRVARAIEAPPERFFSNIRRYGNTSSASMLIAASEWHEQARLTSGDSVCFATFGAGFHWGALLARER
jgi:3-oxoacyl-[acyl-carrier-protein] synthase-3